MLIPYNMRGFCASLETHNVLGRWEPNPYTKSLVTPQRLLMPFLPQLKHVLIWAAVLESPDSSLQLLAPTCG
jgi:hypothetical protein